MRAGVLFWPLALGLLLGGRGRLPAGEEWRGRPLKPEGAAENIAVGPDGRWLVAGSGDVTRLWDLKADDPLARCVVLRGSAGPVSPDGHWLMTVDGDRAIRLWDLMAQSPSAKGREVARYDAGWKSLRGVAISPNGRWLVTVSGDRALRLWDLKARGEPARPRVLLERQGGHVLRSPDGRWMTTGSPAGKVGVWDLAADDPVATTVVRQLNDRGYVGPQGISPDGRWLVTVSPVRRLWDLRAKRPWDRCVAKLGDTTEVRCLDFSADSRWLATGGDDGRTRLYDLMAAGPALRATVITGHAEGENVRAVVFTPNGRWLVTGSDDETARLWERGAGGGPPARSVVLRGHTRPVSFLALSPGGRWLVTGACVPNGKFDRAARLWDLGSAEPAACRAVLGGHGGVLEQVAFSGDGRWLVTHASDKTARLWDLKSVTK
jgi:WD40 repeat protein